MIEQLSIASIWLASLLCVGWARVVLRSFRTLGAIPRLPNSIPLDDNDPHPSVSAIVPLCGRIRDVERAVHSLLAQEAVQMQVILVEDGAPDAEHKKAEVLAKQDPRVLLLKTKKRPVGWVERNYALELGQGRAEGDFLLFTDGDVIHTRRSVRRAIWVMQENKLDHLALKPRLELSGLWQRMLKPMYFLLCELRLLDARAVDPTSEVGAGVGAFNLVNAESYRLRGTHAALRGSLVEERALGRMMRTDDGRGMLMRAVTQVRWRPFEHELGPLFATARTGMLGALSNSPLAAVVSGMLLMAGVVLPAFFLLLGLPLFLAGHPPWMVAPAIIALLLPVFGILRVREMVRLSLFTLLASPLAVLFVGAAALQAGLLLGLLGKIEWRGRAYSRRDLNELA
ncbi:MAG: glycosyltransferase [Deltaproteobacteria bacterium]|nr:glycosyltransferase [Deltaproteobacteria bacterium]